MNNIKEIISSAKAAVDDYQQSDKKYQAKMSIIDGLMNGRIFWYGDFKKDFQFYIKNNHNVMSCFYCHDLHPYSRYERTVVLMSSLFFSFFIVAVIEMLEKNTVYGNRPYMMYLLSFLFGIMNNIYEGIMKCMARCSCVQGRTCRYIPCFKNCCEKIGHCFMFLLFCVSLVNLGLGIYFILGINRMKGIAFYLFIALFFIQAISSSIWSMVSSVVGFSFNWYCCSRKAKDSQTLPELEKILNSKDEEPSQEVNVDTKQDELSIPIEDVKVYESDKTEIVDNDSNKININNMKDQISGLKSDLTSKVGNFLK